MLCTVPAVKLLFFCIKSTFPPPTYFFSYGYGILYACAHLHVCRHTTCVGVKVYGGRTPIVRTIAHSSTATH